MLKVARREKGVGAKQLRTGTCNRRGARWRPLCTRPTPACCCTPSHPCSYPFQFPHPDPPFLRLHIPATLSLPDRPGWLPAPRLARAPHSSAVIALHSADRARTMPPASPKLLIAHLSCTHTSLLSAHSRWHAPRRRTTHLGTGLGSALRPPSLLLSSRSCRFPRPSPRLFRVRCYLPPARCATARPTLASSLVCAAPTFLPANAPRPIAARSYSLSPPSTNTSSSIQGSRDSCAQAWAKTRRGERKRGGGVVALRAIVQA
eukprot:364618-Chlamydomonas_euryale.AAC.6